MPKQPRKNLSVKSIETVDANGEVVAANAMAEIAAEVAVTEGKPEGKEIARFMLALEGLGTEVLVRQFSSGAIYIGAEHLSNKWHVTSFFKIMGALNALGGIRLNRYPVIQEGLHLKMTLAEARKHNEGFLGYVDFSNPELDPDWVARLNAAGITQQDDNWLAIRIGERGKILPGFKVVYETLAECATRLGKELGKLSPFVMENWKQAQRTYNKRMGMEALYRASKGEQCLVLNLVTKPGEESQRGIVTTRFTTLIGSDMAAIAKAIDSAAERGREQSTSDKDTFVATNTPEKAAAVAKTVEAGIVVFGGATVSAQQLVGKLVTRMSGNMPTTPVYLRTLQQVAIEVGKATAKGQTLRIDR